jgi:hypothetical protein
MNQRYSPQPMPSASGRPAASHLRHVGNRRRVGLLGRRIACLHDELWNTETVGRYSGAAFLVPVRFRFQNRGRESAAYGVLPLRAYVRDGLVRALCVSMPKPVSGRWHALILAPVNRPRSVATWGKAVPLTKPLRTSELLMPTKVNATTNFS